VAAGVVLAGAALLTPQSISAQARVIELLADKDPKRSERVMKAMLQMRKIDIAALKRAYEG